MIFPWTYLWAPGALPGGKLFWGILLAMILEIPLAYAYVWLSTAMPRTGGDYVFQSRVFGGAFGFTSLMSGFVLWILQWEALSGWLMAVVGLAPLFIGLGATMNSPALASIGVWCASTWGIIIISIVNAALAMWLLISIICNMNLLPWDPLRALHNPSGVRLAVHEVTRWGMGPQEMADIARFFGQVLLESLPAEKVRTEVMALKAQFDTVRYCFDGET